ncbi:hypothetical protein Hanom_Chr08g00756011 [Helianthus anomalus]
MRSTYTFDCLDITSPLQPGFRSDPPYIQFARQHSRRPGPVPNEPGFRRTIYPRVHVNEPHHLQLPLSPETKQSRLHAFVVVQLETLSSKLCFGQIIYSRERDATDFSFVSLPPSTTTGTASGEHNSWQNSSVICWIFVFAQLFV